jgi:acyl-CoA thioesterase
MESIQALFKNDRFASHSGIELVSVKPGHAMARLSLCPHHLNGLGTVQGGAIFTLADFAFAAAANAAGRVAVAVNASITFVKAVREGALTADAREMAVNPKLGTYTVNVTDGTGELVAVFQGLAYRKKESVEELMRGIR